MADDVKKNRDILATAVLVVLAFVAFVFAALVLLIGLITDLILFLMQMVINTLAYCLDGLLFGPPFLRSYLDRGLVPDNIFQRFDYFGMIFTEKYHRESSKDPYHNKRKSSDYSFLAKTGSFLLMFTGIPFVFAFLNYGLAFIRNCVIPPKEEELFDMNEGCEELEFVERDTEDNELGTRGFGIVKPDTLDNKTTHPTTPSFDDTEEDDAAKSLSQTPTTS